MLGCLQVLGGAAEFGGERWEDPIIKPAMVAQGGQVVWDPNPPRRKLKGEDGRMPNLHCFHGLGSSVWFLKGLKSGTPCPWRPPPAHGNYMILLAEFLPPRKTSRKTWMFWRWTTSAQCLDSEGSDVIRFKLHMHTEETLLRCYTMRATESGVGVGVGKGGVGWDVNVRFKLHIHTEETLLRCHTMRATESGVGVGVGKGGVGWDVNVRFKLHIHTEETLLRGYTIRVRVLGCAFWLACVCLFRTRLDLFISFVRMACQGSVCPLINKKPFYVATQY